MISQLLNTETAKQTATAVWDTINSVHTSEPFHIKIQLYNAVILTMLLDGLTEVEE